MNASFRYYFASSSTCNFSAVLDRCTMSFEDITVKLPGIENRIENPDLKPDDNYAKKKI